MSTIKSSIYLLFILSSARLSASQDSLYFFNAKADIQIKKMDVVEDFTAHIRYNLTDTIWMSLTGTLGIEGARLLILKDSTYILDKINKISEAFSNDNPNPFFPFIFQLSDWKLFLINTPLPNDSNTLLIDNENGKTIQHIDTIQTKTLLIKNHLIQYCEWNHRLTQQKCKANFEDYIKTPQGHFLAKRRSLDISDPQGENVQISIAYVDYKFNSPKPFPFNFAKYKP